LSINKENVRKWVEALRSGKYKQAQGQLYLDGAYCCLGVVCELAGLSVSQGGYYGEPFDANHLTLPSQAAEWLGVDDENPVIGEYCASAWNDAYDKTFPEIADLIEKHWLGEEVQHG
jgi:hypothetical protein